MHETIHVAREKWLVTIVPKDISLYDQWLFSYDSVNLVSFRFKLLSVPAFLVASFFLINVSPGKIPSVKIWQNKVAHQRH